jgi:hypothetical protein
MLANRGGLKICERSLKDKDLNHNTTVRGGGGTEEMKTIDSPQPSCQ